MIADDKNLHYIALVPPHFIGPISQRVYGIVTGRITNNVSNLLI